MLIVLSLKGKLWAYIATIVLGSLYFPASVGFQLNIKTCEVFFDLPLAIYSLTNYKHIILFAIFFLMTRRQVKKSGWVSFGWGALGTLLFALIIELLQGWTGDGHCRMRDLVPDFAGVLLGQMTYSLWTTIKRTKQRRI